MNNIKSEKIKNKIIQFMYGRSGPDDLYKASITVCLVLMLINLITRSAIVSIAAWALLLWGIFRCLSKNVYKRQRENMKYLDIKNGITKKLSMTKTKLTDKEHIYKKCPSCKAQLRFPNKSGEHTAICPKCRHKFSFRTK